MVAKQFSLSALTIVLTLMCSYSVCSQNIEVETQESFPNNLDFYDYRGSNAVDFAMGTSIINGDLSDPKFEIFFHVGYKRYILPYLNLNFSYNKFNLAYTDIYNEGFMSFDLNIESTIFPYSKFSPFIFAGGGFNAANYFEQTAPKIQGGAGLEYIVGDGLGLKLYADYNYVFSDELDGLILGTSDDTYVRVGVGVNYYFGGDNKRKKILENEPSMFKSNKILNKN